MIVAQHHWAGADQIVDVFVVVFIPKTRPLTFLDDDPGLKVAEAARGQNLFSALDNLFLIHASTCGLTFSGSYAGSLQTSALRRLPEIITSRTVPGAAA